MERKGSVRAMCVCVGVEGAINRHSVETSTDHQQNIPCEDRRSLENDTEPWYSNCDPQNPKVPRWTFMGSASKFPLK